MAKLLQFVILLAVLSINCFELIDEPLVWVKTNKPIAKGEKTVRVNLHLSPICEDKVVAIMKPKMNEDLFEAAQEICESKFQKDVYKKLESVCSVKGPHQESAVVLSRSPRNPFQPLLGGSMTLSNYLRNANNFARGASMSGALRFAKDFASGPGKNALKWADKVFAKGGTVLGLYTAKKVFVDIPEEVDGMQKEIQEITNHLNTIQFALEKVDVETNTGTEVSFKLLQKLFEITSVIQDLENFARTGVLPPSVIREFNLDQIEPLKENLDQDFYFNYCELDKKNRSLVLELRVLKTDKNLMLLKSNSFKIFEDDYCFLNYVGPSYVIWNGTTICESNFDSFDLTLDYLSFSVCKAKNFTDNYFVSTCLDKAVERDEKVQLVRTSFSTFIYCPDSQIDVGGLKSKCPDQVFKMPIGSPFLINGRIGFSDSVFAEKADYHPEFNFKEIHSAFNFSPIVSHFRSGPKNHLISAFFKHSTRFICEFINDYAMYLIFGSVVVLLQILLVFLVLHWKGRDKSSLTDGPFKIMLK